MLLAWDGTVSRFDGGVLLELGGSTVDIVTIGVAAALPELTTVMDAVRRQLPNITLGTLVGSNVVNLLVGIGLGGALSTYYVPSTVVLWDLPFKIHTGAALLGWTVYWRGGELTRKGPTCWWRTSSS